MGSVDHTLQSLQPHQSPSPQNQIQTLPMRTRRGGSSIKTCSYAECNKQAHGPEFRYCLKHGGGYRCQYVGCSRSAYSTKYCSKHGGGPRCQSPGCTKGAISNSTFCRRHGGGPRCQHPNCPEGARQGFQYCLAHGGYNPCVFPSCPLPSLHTSSYCRQHNSYQRKINGIGDAHSQIPNLFPVVTAGSHIPMANLFSLDGAFSQVTSQPDALKKDK
jgi:hypothetical protein